jgi:hypothetical protein
MGMMNKAVYLCLTMCLVLSSCIAYKTGSEGPAPTDQQVQKPEKQAVPEITFDNAEVDFGKLKQGEKRSHSFTFTNTGREDLIIELATACTCTSIDWPRKPIPPGGKGSIDIVFDSTTKKGQVSVDVDVISNTDPIVVTAVIKANVVTP